MTPKTSSHAFTFGQNWLQYSELLDERRIQDAGASVRSLVRVDSLNGRSFLDVGAGSGLFSLAAVRLGASRVTAVDRDHDCLQAVQMNAKRFLTPEQQARLDARWADVLDRASLPRETFDIVYAWGSLHHTGSMWRAIENASACCASRGLFVLAIYNETWTSPVWWRIKQIYHIAPAPLRWLMASVLTGTRLLARAITGKPLRTPGRGMTIWYDAIDWLGGLPYEYASRSAIEAFLAERGFSLSHCVATRRSGCNEFVFTRNHRVATGAAL